MSHYYNQQNAHGRNRYKKRYISVTKWLVVCAVVAGGIVAVDALWQHRASSNPTDYTAPLKSVVVADAEPFNTQYFQFQAPSSWQAIANETKGTHFVYRSYNASFVEQELVVDVNNAEPEVLALVQTARVLPAGIVDGSSLRTDGALSEHCEKVIKPSTPRSPLRLTMNNVSFVCNPDSATYQIAVGIGGGSTDITLTRPNGQTAKYTIIYRNHTATPNIRDLNAIINSFQSR